MAKMDVGGIDEIVDRMESLGIDLEGELGDMMLAAGAEAAKGVWKSTAEEHGVRATGEMIKRIGYAQKPVNVNGLRTIYIYPQGADPKTGVRNAAKAFYTHYRKNSKHTGWVNDITSKTADAVAQPMQAVLENYINQKGL